MTDTFQPAWLAHAWGHLGLEEGEGRANNPDVIAFYRDAGHPEVRSDAIAWCAAFAGACLERTGATSTRSLLARSYLTWGAPIEVPRLGAIAIFKRGSDPAQGHVGFVVGATPTHIFLLGGNQSDRVSVEAISRDRLLALRWSDPIPEVEKSLPPRDIVGIALDHVFDMEGGYTDDPHDPGGPTNLGITLATYATWRSTTISAETFGALKAELRSLDRNTAAQIYRARYWSRCAAEYLPDPIALMHFDASVNHGLTGAARMLQEACGVEIDAEIGPDTIAAANAINVATLIDTYADIRIAKYRALPHFWRFGRGWLNRVTKTRAACTTLIGRTPAAKPKPTKHEPITSKERPMTTQSPTIEPQPKWWGNSLTIWGTIITALSTVLPVIGPLIGLDITAEMIRDIGQGMTQVVQALGGVFGTALAIYGRIRATQPLMRRPVSLML